MSGLISDLYNDPWNTASYCASQLKKYGTTAIQSTRQFAAQAASLPGYIYQAAETRAQSTYSEEPFPILDALDKSRKAYISNPNSETAQKNLKNTLAHFISQSKSGLFPRIVNPLTTTEIATIESFTIPFTRSDINFIRSTTERLRNEHKSHVSNLVHRATRTATQIAADRMPPAIADTVIPIATAVLGHPNVRPIVNWAKQGVIQRPHHVIADIQSALPKIKIICEKESISESEKNKLIAFKENLAKLNNAKKTGIITDSSTKQEFHDTFRPLYNLIRKKVGTDKIAANPELIIYPESFGSVENKINSLMSECSGVLPNIVENKANATHKTSRPTPTNAEQDQNSVPGMLNLIQQIYSTLSPFMGSAINPMLIASLNYVKTFLQSQCGNEKIPENVINLMQQMIADIEESEAKQDPSFFLNKISYYLKEIANHPITFFGFPVPGTGEGNPFQLFDAQAQLTQLVEKYEQISDDKKIDPFESELSETEKTQIKKEFDITTSRYTTLRIIWEKLCKQQADPSLYKEILGEGTKGAKKPGKAIRKAFFKMIDQSNLSFFMKIIAKLAYFFISPFAHFFIRNFSTNITNEVHGYIEVEKKDHFKHTLNLVINNLTGYFNVVNTSYRDIGNSTADKLNGTIRETLDYRLGLPATHNHELGKKELYKRVTKKGVSELGPCFTWTKHIHNAFNRGGKGWNNGFASVCMNTFAFLINIFVWPTQWISNVIMKFGIKLFLNKTEMVNSIIDNAAKNIHQNNEYSYAFNCILSNLLKKVVSKLSTSGNEETRNKLSEIKANLTPERRLQLRTFIKTIFHTLDYESKETLEDLRNFVNGDISPVDKYVKKPINDLVIEDVIENAILVILFAHESFVNEKEIEKLYYNFLKMTNGMLSSETVIDPADFIKKEKEVGDWINGIIHFTVEKAVDNKINPNTDLLDKRCKEYLFDGIDAIPDTIPFAHAAKDKAKEFFNDTVGSAQKQRSVRIFVQETTTHIDQCLTKLKISTSTQEKQDIIKEIRNRFEATCKRISALRAEIDRDNKLNDQMRTTLKNKLAEIVPIFETPIPVIDEAQKNPGSLNLDKFVESIETVNEELKEWGKNLQSLTPINITWYENIIKPMIQKGASKIAEKKIREIVSLGTNHVHVRHGLIDKIGLEPFLFRTRSYKGSAPKKSA